LYTFLPPVLGDHASRVNLNTRALHVHASTVRSGFYQCACVTLHVDDSLMEQFCFDFPREVFPIHQQPGPKEGYGRLSGWLPGEIFKCLGDACALL